MSTHANVYFQMTDEVVQTLLNGIGTINSQADLLSNWTDSTQNLTEAWVQNPADPSQAQQNLINAINAASSNGAIASIISTYVNEGDLNLWNSSLAVALLTKLSQNWDTTNGPAQLNTINNWASIITSTATNETAPGNTETKEVQSMVQQSVSGSQVVANIGTLMVGLLTAFASATGLSA
ncbi:MAG: hypothetical protein HY861_03170 [Chlamydiia bacterium]|nr:hypothetical protein [Chlamydiia bacterium]